MREPIRRNQAPSDAIRRNQTPLLEGQLRLRRKQMVIRCNLTFGL